LPSLQVSPDGDNGIRLVSEGLSSVNLAALTTAAKIEIAGSAHLASLELPALERLERYLKLTDNEELTTVDAPALTMAALVIVNNAALTTVSAPALAAAAGVEVEGNSALATLSLPQLAEVNVLLSPASGVSSYFEVINNDALTNVDAPLLSSIVGDGLLVQGNQALKSVHFPSVALIDELSIKENQSLVDLEFTALDQVYYFTIFDNPVLPCSEVSTLLAQTDGGGYYSTKVDCP